MIKTLKRSYKQFPGREREDFFKKFLNKQEERRKKRLSETKW
jgi:hypothetical protein